MLESRVYSGAAPKRVAAFPTTSNPFAWRGLVEGSSSYTMFDLNIESDFDPTEGREFYPSDRDDVIRVVSAIPAFRDFLAFSQYPFWSTGPTSEPEGGLLVELYD